MAEFKGKGKAVAPGPEDGSVWYVEEDLKRPPSSVVGTTSTPFGFTTFEPARLHRHHSTTSHLAASAAPSDDVVADQGVSGRTQQTSIDAGQRNLTHNHAAHVREDPIEFARQASSWASGTGWRAYEDYIGQKIFYEGYSEDCINSIMNSPRIKQAVYDLSKQRLDNMKVIEGVNRDKELAKVQKQFREVVRQMASGMVAKMDSIRVLTRVVYFLRMFGFMINNVLVRMYQNGIHISLEEFKVFRAAAINAANKKQSMLILPCHKSHIDYLTISWIFYRLGLSLPHIVAGDNLNMPLVGPMLQACGAFYIRRSFGDDKLYPLVVKEYIEQLLEKGMNIECFIEGTRSRTGKVLPPKLGILKYVVEALQAGRTDDVWICPISVQYDKVIETETYVNELLGNPKEKETLTQLILNTRVLQLQLGRIDVRFQKPFSLKEYIADFGAKRKTDLNPGGKTDQTVLLKALGYQVMSDINRCAVIMPAALVGSVMLTIRGRGVGRTELIKRVTWLKAAIEARGGRVAEFGKMDVGEVVDRALVVLKDLIGEHKDILEPTFYPASRFELSFYRNQIMHLFVSESMLAAALYTHVKAGGAAPSQRMTRSEVLDELFFMSRLLQNEFVYGTEGLETNATQTIAALERQEVVLVEGDLIGLHPKERATGRENYDFYCFLLWPFIETYWLAAVSLFALTPTTPPPNPANNVPWVAAKAFEASVQKLGKALFYQGDVSYLEAVNQATLSNAFLRLVEAGVLLTRKSDTNVNLMALHPDWLPTRSAADGGIEPAGKLWDFLSRLSAFRREGKNRRDGATVGSRVLRHCSTITPPVLLWTPFEGVTKAESEFWKSKPMSG